MDEGLQFQQAGVVRLRLAEKPHHRSDRKFLRYGG